MDDTEENARHPPNSHGVNQAYGSSQQPKLSIRNPPYPQQINDKYIDVDDDDDEEAEEVEEEEEEHEEEVDEDENGVDNEENGAIQQNGDDIDDEDDDIDGRDEDDEDDDNDHNDHKRTENVNLPRHPKKRKLKSLLSSYEFAPRVAAPSTAAISAPKRSYGGRNTLADWTEHETFILLEAWGERFLQRGRKSLRSEEWQEVSEKVSQESKMERTDTQCRNRLDTLKKKYKKEKAKLEGTRGAISKWVYFKKMDMLMSSTPQQQGLSCGVDSGEYVFMNPSVYLNRANGLDEMRDSPGNSDSREGDDDSDLLPPKRARTRGDRGGDGSFKLLADSIYKFSEIYEKIESSKRQQMLELEKMRMDFHRELELQKRQILDRARDEIAKIRQGDSEENDVSTENVSG